MINYVMDGTAVMIVYPEECRQEDGHRSGSRWRDGGQNRSGAILPIVLKAAWYRKNEAETAVSDRFTAAGTAYASRNKV
jgi:hypothetical protein